MALFATVLTVNFTACVDDPCADVICNNGTCFDGDCVCDVGFEIDPVTGDCIASDPCLNVVCGDNSECSNGECLCDGGYEKDANDECVLEREKFFGLYETIDICPNDTFRYDIVITELGTSSDSIKIQNLGDFICEDPNTGQEITYHVEASVIGDSFSFTGFETCNTIFEGSGIITDGIITINYKATYEDPTFGTTTDECTATLTKK